jgi:hypothetical protein
MFSVLNEEYIFKNINEALEKAKSFNWTSKNILGLRMV